MYLTTAIDQIWIFFEEYMSNKVTYLLKVYRYISIGKIKCVNHETCKCIIVLRRTVFLSRLP